jgi:hypothetical protein
MNARTVDVPFADRRLGWRWLVLLAAFSALAIGLLAPHVAGAQQVVTSDPLQITVAGEVGQRTERLLILTATAPVTGVSTLMTQLVRADNAAAIPQSAIGLGATVEAIEGGSRVTLPVTFDLSGAASGEYAGSLLVSYYSGGFPTSTMIPVTVSIKDGPWGALLMLVIGVAIASLISIYRAELQPRDELALRSDKLRTQVNRNADGMYDAFAHVFNRNFELVSLALQSSRLEQARQTLDEAEALLSAWVQGRAEWVRLGAFAAEIVNGMTAKGIGDTTPFFLEIRQQVADALAASVQTRDPAALQTQLNTTVALVNDYLRVKAKCDDLQEVFVKTEAEQKHAGRTDEFAQRVAAIGQEQAKLRADSGAMQAIEAQAQSLIDELKALPAPPRAGMLSGDSGGLVGAATRTFQERAPELFTQIAMSVSKITPPPAAQGRGAAWRIWAFRMARFTIAIAFLAGAGFTELYLGKATFGANWWSDYFALLLWGFSAETSRAAITDLTRNLGIPGQQPQQ